MTKRQMFHHEGVTDLAVMRRDAQRAADKGEDVTLHLHPYDDEWDGCNPKRLFNSKHEFFEAHATKVPA